MKFITLIIFHILSWYYCYGKVKNFVDPMLHEITLVTGRSFESLLNRQRNADGVTVLLHYSEKIKPHGTYIETVYNEAAKDLKGMVKFTAINCAEWITLCDQHQNTTDLKLPTVFIYSSNRLIPPENLFQPNKEKISKSALRYIPGDRVETVSLTKLDEFLNLHAAMPKVLLFSSKQSVPVLYKALSNSFKDRVNFGIVFPSEKDLEEKYKVRKRPMLLTVRNDSKQPDIYKGEFNFNALHSWINIHAETFVKGGGFTTDDKNVAEKPKKLWMIQKVPEITGASYRDVCLKSSATLCMIYMSNGPLVKEALNLLYKLSDEFNEGQDRGAKFRWAWMDLQIEKKFAQTFDIKDYSSELPTLIALNPHKRIRYMKLPEHTKADLQSIQKLVEKIISGDGRFTLVKAQKLPPFAPRPTLPNDEL